MDQSKSNNVKVSKQCSGSASKIIVSKQTSYYKLTIVYNLFHLVLANELPFRRSTNPTGLPGTSTDNTLVNSGLYTVIHLKVELRKLVLLVSGGFLDISKR